jgi:hypothetical protein
VTFEIDESTSRTWRAILVDSAGQFLALSGIQTLTLTLYAGDKYPATPTDAVINNRNAQDVLNTNDCTYDEVTGELVWQIRPEDTVIVDAVRGWEKHVALFEIVYLNGAGITHTARKRVDFRVRNHRLAS